MKLLIILSLITTSLVYGEETKTECPWMREMNKRNNPKAGLVGHNSKLKLESKSNISTRQ
jgi:hypothetical protein